MKCEMWSIWFTSLDEVCQQVAECESINIQQLALACVCVCVCACVRTCVRVCVCVTIKVLVHAEKSSEKLDSFIQVFCVMLYNTCTLATSRVIYCDTNIKS